MQQHILARLKLLSLFLGAVLATAGCVVVPRTTTSYDAECNMVKRSITLEAQQMTAIGSCRNSAECAGLLAGAGVVSAASVVVSGSVAVVGNVVYWIERQGKCVRGGVAPQESEPREPSPSAQPAATTGE